MIELPSQEKWAYKDLMAAYRALFQYDYDDDDISDLDEYKLLKNIDVSKLPSPDFPHSEHHIQTVINYSAVMAKKAGLSEEWVEKIKTSAKYHDITNGLVEVMKLSRSQHAIFSSVLAFMITGDRDIADVIYYHDYDTHSALYPFDDRNPELNIALGILRDADQLALMGYSGLIRMAYYWGFRDSEFFDSEEQIERGIVCDVRFDENGLPDDVDVNPRTFCFEKLFNYIFNNPHLLKEILKHAETNLDRFFGKTNKRELFIRLSRIDPDFKAKVVSGELLYERWFVGKQGGLHYIVDPVSPIYSHLFIKKMFLELEIRDLALKLLDVLENDRSADLRKVFDEIKTKLGDEYISIDGTV